MKWFACSVIFLVVALLIVPARGAPQDKIGGRLGEPPKKRTTTDPAKKKQVSTSPVRPTKQPPVKTLKDRIGSLEKKIKALQAQDRDKLNVIGLDYAKERLAKLEKKSKEQRRLLDGSGLKAAQEVGHEVERLKKKWEPLAESLKSDSDRPLTSDQWQDIARKILKDEPKPIGNSDTAPPADPGQSSDGTPKEPDTRTPQKILGELAKAINEQKKPRGMSGATWAALLDQFQKDNSQLQAKSAALRRKWKQQRDQQYGPVDSKLAAAQRTLAALEKLPQENMSDRFYNHMARRLHEANLAQLRRELQDAQGLYRELEGTPGGLERQLIVASSTGDHLDTRFIKTLDLMGRLMDTNTAAIPPSLEAFDQQTTDELRKLFGGDLDLSDPEALAERIRQARVRMLQERLRVLNNYQTNIEKVIDAMDQEEIQTLRDGMEFDDRLEDREDHPSNQAKRRVAEKELRKKQRDTREERIDELKFELNVEIGKTKKRLAEQMELAPKPDE